MRIAVGWAVAVLLAAGCKRAEAPKAPEPAVRFLELFPNRADTRSPLIVAIHGRGDTPENFAQLWDGFPGKAQLALPQAPIAFGPGWSWFHWTPGMTQDELAAEIAPHEEQLWRGIVHLARGRKVIVTGFSQGGVLSFVLAARHPGEIVYAFPVSGGAPARLLPREGARAAPVFALHGSADGLVNPDLSRTAVAALKKTGSTAELREYPGVGHTVTPQMRADLFERILEVLNRKQD